MYRMLLLGILSVVALSGCALGPDYRRPAVETPPAWQYEEKQARDTINTAWWEQFGDPVLNDLIASAIQGSLDLKIAAARVEEYEGRYGVARADLFPPLSATGKAGRSRSSEKVYSLPEALQDRLGGTSSYYQGAFASAWEIDIWGRIRRSTEAARANLLGMEDARRGVILSLVASVATGYINLRDLDEQLDIAQRTAQSRGESYQLFQSRFKGGVISEMELYQVKSLYDQSLARIPMIKNEISQQESALCLLLGRNPGPIPRGKTIEQLILPAVPQGLPSDLLDRRPDILQAEQNLVAANANIGVAKALYFPSISLTGTYGWASQHLSDFISKPSTAWNWGGGVDIPIFAWGAIKGQNKAARAMQQEMLFAYQKTIQNAFREVNDALISQALTREQIKAQKDQVDDLKGYAKIAQMRFDNGYTSYIEVLDAERSLFDAELSYAQSQGMLYADLINLYKVMGGGWQPPSPSPDTEK